MIIEDGKFYFVKDDFFNIFKEYKLMGNKENGNKRPCYFCFRDRKDSSIIWFVPVSTKYEKYKELYEKKKQNNGNRQVFNFVFGSVLGKKSVFLIQNIFPITEKYIANKYVNSNIDVAIPKKLKDKVIVTSLRVVELAERGINIPFYNIIEMKNILLNEKV